MNIEIMNDKYNNNKLILDYISPDNFKTINSPFKINYNNIFINNLSRIFSDINNRYYSEDFLFHFLLLNQEYIGNNFKFKIFNKVIENILLNLFYIGIRRDKNYVVDFTKNYLPSFLFYTIFEDNNYFKIKTYNLGDTFIPNLRNQDKNIISLLLSNHDLDKIISEYRENGTDRINFPSTIIKNIEKNKDIIEIISKDIISNILENRSSILKQKLPLPLYKIIEMDQFLFKTSSICSINESMSLIKNERKILNTTKNIENYNNYIDFLNTLFDFKRYNSIINKQTNLINNSIYRSYYNYFIKDDNLLIYDDCIIYNYLKHEKESFLIDDKTINEVSLKYQNLLKSNYNIRSNLVLFENNLEHFCISYTFKNEKEKKIIIDLLASSKNNIYISPIILTTQELLDKKQKLYTHFQLTTKTGKIREIYAPHNDLKKAQKFYLKNYLTRVYMKKAKNNRYSYAFTKEKDCLKATEMHKNNKYIMVIDFSDFFGTINKTLVNKKIMFILNKLTNNYKELFMKTVINPKTKGIYQGSPLSGIIANYCSKKFIIMLNNVLNYNHRDEALNENDKIYQEYLATIYADDITISSPEKIDKKYVYSAILYCIEKLNLPFKINYKKTKLFSNQRRNVLGYRINNQNMIIKPKKYLNKINFRVTIHKLAIGELDPKEVFTKKFIGQLNEVFKSEREKDITDSSLKRYIFKFNDSKYVNNIPNLLKKYGVKYDNYI